MANDEMCVVYVTAPDSDTALSLGQAMVEERLAACVNTWSGMQSVYRWEGKLCVDEEVVLLFKTRRDLADALIGAIEARHPYDTPCALVLEVPIGASGYLQWLRGEVADTRA